MVVCCASKTAASTVYILCIPWAVKIKTGNVLAVCDACHAHASTGLRFRFSESDVLVVFVCALPPWPRWAA